MPKAVSDVTARHFKSKFVPIFKPQGFLFFYFMHTILECRLKAFPIPEPINLNWITVLFKLLHFGDASNDLWERIVTNINQSVGGKRRLALQRAPRRVSGRLL